MAKMTKEAPKKTEAFDPSAIMARMEQLEAQNKELTDKMKSANTTKDAKKRYDWPHTYSYKIYNGFPVIDYKSKRKEENRPTSFKNAKGEVVNNQLLILTLAGSDDKPEVDVNEFNMYFQYSEKLEAEVIDNGEAYKFDTKEHGEFTVPAKLIN